MVMVDTMTKNGVTFTASSLKKHTQKRALPSLKQRWKNLKCDFSFFRYMANRSGCSLDEDAHIPDVPKDAWIDLKEKDPNRYKMLTRLFYGTIEWRLFMGRV